MVITESMKGLNLIGGRPSLDFTNTEGGERNGPPERIASYGDLLAWSVKAGVLSQTRASRLATAARERSAEAEKVYGRAVALRESLYRILSGAISGTGAQAGDLDLLDRELGPAMAHRRLVPAGGAGFEWRFEDVDALDRPLWTIVHDAADLLSSSSLGRVKECGGETCTWLFLDESRNRSRRWCDMGDCGNRAKARRYRRRHGT
jgi:predicted RNA-binding Zn ribbon-like protein